MSLNENHLYEERLIAAVLVEEDLSQEELDHLALCPSCQALRDNIAADLTGLEEFGRQTVQVPPRSFQLPDEPPVVSRSKPKRLALGGSLALAAVALIAVWLGVWGPQTAPAPTTRLAPASARVAAPGPLAMPQRPLYDDSDALAGLGMPEVEPFSPFQRFVLGGDQTETSEEFMDFIMPEPGIHGRGKQGGAA